LGFLYVIAASILFGIFPSIQKSVMAAGATPIALVIICNGVAGLLSLCVSLAQRKDIRVTRKQLTSLLLIGVIGLFTTDFLLNIAYTLIPVGYVTMIHFLYPTLVCAAMSAFFHEKLTRHKIFAVILSVSGLALLAGGSFSGSVLGIAVAAATAFSYSFYMIATDRTAAREVDPMVRVFYTNMSVTAAGLVCSVKMAAVFPAAAVSWLDCFIIGAMLCAAIFLINAGVKKIGAGAASFINMTEPVTSLVVSALVYRYSLTPMALAGCALIVGSLFFAAKS
jgi:drug/metabolite transporter (DMT)-like permease